MTSRLDALCVRACDPQQLARFGAGVLGWGLDIQADIVLVPNDDTGVPDPFLPTREQKVGENQMHFDLTPPVDGDLEAEVERLVSLGATRMDIGQGSVPWVWRWPIPTAMNFVRQAPDIRHRTQPRRLDASVRPR